MGWQIIRTDKRYSTYLNARLLMASWTIGVPFLIIFANDRLGFRTGDLGIFIAADCIGVIAGSFFWERLTDRRSAKACLEIVALLSALLPVIVLLFLIFPMPRLIYPLVFSIAAAVDAGTGIGGLTYLIEISPEHDRSTYIGLFNSLMALPCFLAAAAGALLDWAGYGLLYGLVLALSAASLIAVNKLEHIRKRPAMEISPTG
jgi:predicted MFS family arabinose efflux permease